jgi:hypothetical protein
MVAHSISGSRVPISFDPGLKVYSLVRKDEDWFLRLKEKPGLEEEVQIGKDIFLELIGGKKGRVDLLLHNRSFEGASELRFWKYCSKSKGGAYYYDPFRNPDNKIWTCNLLLLIFGDFPDKIFFRKEFERIIN